MVRSVICRVVLLVLFSLFLGCVNTASFNSTCKISGHCGGSPRPKETLGEPGLASRDYQDTISGEPPSDVPTRNPPEVQTESVTSDYEDATNSQNLDEDQGVLGPGAITAIVIAVFLGASVLLALIVITLRKFMAS